MNIVDRINQTQFDSRNTSQRTYIGASIIGSACTRSLWYTFRGAKEVSFPARILRRFESGDHYESRLIEWLVEAGYEVRCENPRAKNNKKQYAAEEYGGLFRGHVDGFVKGHELDCWHLLEVKAMASAKYKQDSDGEPCKNKQSGSLEGRWWRVKRLGCKKTQPTHYAQMQAYMGFSQDHYEKWGLEGPITKALYVCINTDTDQIHAEVIDFDAAWYNRIRSRVMEIARSIEPPSRLHQNPSDFDCRYCDYQGICHLAEPMRIECRTCKHATMMVPGDKGYYAKRAQWTCTLHKQSCGTFEACEQYETIETHEEAF